LKILFLSRQLNIGGAERQLVTLANELAARGHEIVIASYYPGGALAEMIDPKRIKVISYEKKSRWDLFTLFFQTLKIVRDEQPTVLHGWMHTQNVVAAVAKALNPKLTMVWAVRASNLEQHLDWVEKLTIWLQARLSGFATRITVNSMAGLEYAAQGGLPREKMMFVPNGIDTNVFYPSEEERSRVRAQWNLGDDVKIVGNISRFDPIKNHKMFLKAAAAVAAERSDVRFVCVGHGKESYLQELKQLSRTLGLDGKVLWIQAQSEVRAVYNAVDVFCSSSVSEGFPNVIGEAMACGRHCVVTDVGDSALVIGDTGVVVPSDNPQAFAAGLLDRLNAPDKLNLRGRQRILENFTVAHLGDKSEYALYQAVQQSHPNLSQNEEVARSADA
jgi:glycosyltransferase involved in cell wall biosynthesis